jgi:hypothetical protein
MEDGPWDSAPVGFGASDGTRRVMFDRLQLGEGVGWVLGVMRTEVPRSS